MVGLKEFYNYEKVRRSGAYNMITECKYASKAAGLTIKEYSEVIKRYSLFKLAAEKQFGSLDNFMKDFK